MTIDLFSTRSDWLWRHGKSLWICITNIRAIGGLDAEREERARQRQAEIDEHTRNFEAMKRLQDEARARRRATYGEEEEPVYSEPIEGLRQSMMDKIQSSDDDQESVEDEEVPPAEVMASVQAPDEGFPAIRSRGHISTDGKTIRELNEESVPIAKTREALPAPKKVLITEVDDVIVEAKERVQEIVVAQEENDLLQEVYQDQVKSEPKIQEIIEDAPVIKKKIVSSVKATRQLLKEVTLDDQEEPAQEEMTAGIVAPAADLEDLTKSAWE